MLSVALPTKTVAPVTNVAKKHPYSLEASSISVSLGPNLVLDQVSFKLKPHTMYALVGVNGAGKSTLFRAMLGLVPLSQGQFSCFGKDMALARKEGAISYIPQYDSVDLNFPLSVEDIVMMGRYSYQNIFRTPKAHDFDLVDAALCRTGIQELRHRQIAELSGGQRKRVFIARSLAQEARIMLLDEIFAGVDKKSELAILSVLRELVDEGKSMLVAVHDLRQAKNYFDEVIVLNRKLVTQGPARTTLSANCIAKAYNIDLEAAQELI